uniref:Ret finger protein-like 4B n=1 Tax=Otolemur garnettii TaxID=30611 RepID=H0XIJ0_OTOGA
MAKSLYAEGTCSICLDLLTNPFSLFCGHTFCLDCIGSWASQRQNSKLICPLCRAATEKPPMEERQMRMLILLLKQHGPLLELTLHVSPELQRFREDMSLDAATANSLLVISEDLRSIQRAKSHQDVKEDPRRFTHLACVLGAPSFSTGQHYWEVDVGEVREWSLGVCKESVDRRQSDLSPERGFWIISMKAGAICANFTPESRIPASPRLERVGIFLDVELEEIRFFDVGNDALICRYIPVSSLEPFRPFFLLNQAGEGDGGVLRICP